MRNAIRAEGICHAADGRGIMSFRQDEAEPMRGHRAQRERREERDVVHGSRRAAQPLQRRRQQALAEPVVGERHEASRRIECESRPTSVA